MIRSLTLCAAGVLLTGLALAAEPTKPTETLIKMTVEARAAPRPAMRYHLLPEIKEMNPGNAIHGYLVCFMEQNTLFFNKQSVDNREKWQVCPLTDLPLVEVREYGGGASRQADFAARLDGADWGVLLKLKRDGIHLLLPDLQQLRSLAAVLKVRFRAEIAERRFDDAIRTASTMFALARHLGEHPTLIGDLVGMAVASLATGPLEEMIQQPGCPNLYWAYTDLPVPFIDLRKGLQGEKLLDSGIFQQIDDTHPMSEEQLKKLVDSIREFLKYLDGPGGPKIEVSAWLDRRVQNAEGVAAARKRLAELGIPQERLQKFPPLQIVLLAERFHFEIRRDDAIKGMALPYWQAAAASVQKGPGLEVERIFGQEGESGFGQLIPAIMKVKRAQARMDQRIGMLRTVEAIRMYAAEHGKPPAQLDDIKLPLPVDPFTGKPFKYSVDGKTFHVRGSPPPGDEATAIFNVHYEITIK